MHHPSTPGCCKLPKTSLEKKVFRVFGVGMSLLFSWLCHIRLSSSLSCIRSKRTCLALPRQCSESEMTSAKNTANEIDDDACEGSLGSTEGDNSFHKEKSQLIGRKDTCTSFQQKARKSYEKKADIEGAANNDVDDIKEACSGTEEGQRLSNFDSKLRAESRNIAHVQPPGQSSKRRSKKVLFGGGTTNEPPEKMRKMRATP